MFEFAFDAELLPFKYQSPALEPLFQFPPTYSTTHTQSGGICPIYSVVSFCLSLPKGEGIPLGTPSKRSVRKTPADARARVRRGVAAIQVPKPGIGAKVPIPADIQHDAATAVIVVIANIGICGTARDCGENGASRCLICAAAQVLNKRS